MALMADTNQREMLTGCVTHLPTGGSLCLGTLVDNYLSKQTWKEVVLPWNAQMHADFEGSLVKVHANSITIHLSPWCMDSMQVSKQLHASQLYNAQPSVAYCRQHTVCPMLNRISTASISPHKSCTQIKLLLQNLHCTRAQLRLLSYKLYHLRSSLQRPFKPLACIRAQHRGRAKVSKQTFPLQQSPA